MITGKTTKTDEQGASRFKIGAVARLTGIPVETIRVWERRYQAVAPHRSEGGSRLYDSEDVARLTAMKQLVDAGNAISTIARLSLEELERRQLAANTPNTRHISPNRNVRVGSIGPTLPMRLLQALDSNGSGPVQLVCSYANIREFEQDENKQPLDGLIVEVPVLIGESVNQLRQLQNGIAAGQLIVVYGYGKRESARQLEKLGIATIQHPVNWPELIRMLNVAHSPATPLMLTGELGELLDKLPTRRHYDDHQLALVSSQGTKINCECPHHIVDLVLSLNHFEMYSAQCENQSDDDAALHAQLQSITAKARALMEIALEQVIAAEGIKLENVPGSAEQPGKHLN